VDENASKWAIGELTCVNAMLQPQPLETVSVSVVSGRPDCFRLDSTGRKGTVQQHELRASDDVCIITTAAVHPPTTLVY
jgi:hypothetical protein